MAAISGYESIDFADAVAVARKMNSSVRKNDLCEVRKLYQALCKSSMLVYPEDDYIRQCDGTEYLCCVLYREIYNRRFFATAAPTLAQWTDSWCNYCHIFQALSLMSYTHFPYEWLWDLVDEFVNQFQSFCQHRARALETKTEHDIYLIRLQHEIRLNFEVWSVHNFLKLLQGLIKRSSIIQILNQAKDGGLQLLTAPADNVLKVLGYFSMVGLLRVHCLLGNYQAGLDCLLPIDISQQGFYTSLIATRITTIYHYGFANLMLGWYAKAIQEFNRTLVYIFEIKKPQQNEQILSKIEKMYALLAICLSRCPSQHQFIDENVKSQLMEKYGEKMSRMQRYDDDDDAAAADLYRELLSYAWPTFSTPFAPSSGDPREVYDKEELAFYDAKLLAIAYPEFFGPNASSYVESYANHHQQLDSVIASLLDLYI